MTRLVRSSLSVALVSILALQSARDGKALPKRTQSETFGKQTVKGKTLQIPPGSIVRVTLHNKEKVRGQLGDVTTEGFTVKVARGNKIEDRKLSFAEVKSVRREGRGAGTWIAVGAAVGGILLLLTIIGLSNAG
jgi:hypothetical protein